MAFASHSGWALKFRYPFTEETLSNASRGGNEAASSSAIACGAILRTDAKGKHGKVRSPWLASRLG